MSGTATHEALKTFKASRWNQILLMDRPFRQKGRTAGPFCRWRYCYRLWVHCHRDLQPIRVPEGTYCRSLLPEGTQAADPFNKRCLALEIKRALQTLAVFYDRSSTIKITLKGQRS